MTAQDKALKIIEELQLSARQVAEAIGKSADTASDKIKQRKYNKFSDEDFDKLKSFYVEKLKTIKAL
ncbi:hypothetical protein [Chryseobacterium sp.]|uniref:hypothetical protein n=1 Tax=Chryseobacterium sp. TaxID=1871047 RepID=UPI00289F5DDB|nr:hypothetical protein [Chryseobacterium sp.]